MNKTSPATITILMDNQAYQPELKAEHGLSMLVEKDGMRILFDTGQTDNLQYNGRAMGVALHNLDAVVLSHGHFDHSGGLMSVVRKNPGIRVYGHPAIFESKYADHGRGKIYIGMQYKLQDYQKAGANFVLSESSQEIGPGIFSSGHIDRVNDFERVSPAFIKDTGRNFISDNLEDDGCLIIEQGQKIILILGCTHSGLINTLDLVSRKWDKDHFALIIGGLHLSDKDSSYVTRVLERANRFKIDKLIPLHCSGLNHQALFEHYLGHRVEYGGAGKVINCGEEC